MVDTTSDDLILMNINFVSYEHTSYTSKLSHAFNITYIAPLRHNEACEYVMTYVSTSANDLSPRAIRTPSLLIWSQTRYRCAMGPIL